MPVPATGTFRVYPQSIWSITNNFTNIGGSRNTGFSLKGRDGSNPPADTIDAGGINTLAALQYPTPVGFAPTIARSNLVYTSLGANVWGAVPGEHKIDLEVDTTSIYFNFGTVDEQIVDILSGEFPSGFQATNLRVNVIGTGRAVDLPDGSGITNAGNSLLSIGLLWNGFQIASMPVPAYNPAGNPLVFTGDSGATAIVGTDVYLTAASSFKNIGITFDFASNGSQDLGGGSSVNFVNAWIDQNKIYLTGDYIAASWTAVIEVTPEEASVGQIVTITNAAGRLDEINDCVGEDSGFTLTFNDVDGNLVTVAIPCSAILSRTEYEIRLMLSVPYGTYVPYGGAHLVLGASVTSVEYTGSVTLATLNQLLVDGSGIYKLVTSKTNDTYYDRTNPLAPVEVDLKIPNPFIRTGYF